MASKYRDLETGELVDPEVAVNPKADATYVTPAEVGDPLAKNPDAMECGACLRTFIPEKSDGVLIVHVIRVQGDPPGTPGLGVCSDCFGDLQEHGDVRKDSIRVN